MVLRRPSVRTLMAGLLGLMVTVAAGCESRHGEVGSATTGGHGNANGVSSATVWNDFTTIRMDPTHREIQECSTTAPDRERATCAARLARALNPDCVPSDFSGHLIALRQWPVDRTPEGVVRGNVFLVRRRAEGYVLQVTEGAGKAVVEIRKSDGARLTKGGADLAEYAKNAARKWLSEAMQPVDFHAVADRSPHVATWRTSDKPDAERMVLMTCRAYSDGAYLRYEVSELVTGTAIAFARPQPYRFSCVDYGLGKDTLPWLGEATQWPPMQAREVARLSRTARTKDRDDFELRLRSSMKRKWLPDRLEDVPYLGDWGFAYVKESEEYRVRVREDTRVAYQGKGGPQVIGKDILVAAEPLSGELQVPETPTAMNALLTRFLNRQVIPQGINDRYATVFRKQDGGVLRRGYTTECASPNYLCAWTNGDVLLIRLWTVPAAPHTISPKPRPSPTQQGTGKRERLSEGVPWE